MRYERDDIPPVEIGRAGILATVDELANVILRLGVIGVALQHLLLGSLEPVDGLLHNLTGTGDGALDGTQADGEERDKGVNLRLILDGGCQFAGRTDGERDAP